MFAISVLAIVTAIWIPGFKPYFHIAGTVKNKCLQSSRETVGIFSNDDGASQDGNRAVLSGERRSAHVQGMTNPNKLQYYPLSQRENPALRLSRNRHF